MFLRRTPVRVRCRPRNCEHGLCEKARIGSSEGDISITGKGTANLLTQKVCACLPFGLALRWHP